MCLSIPPPFNKNDWKNKPTPNIIEMPEDGTPRPVRYELKDEKDTDARRAERLQKHQSPQDSVGLGGDDS